VILEENTSHTVSSKPQARLLNLLFGSNVNAVASKQPIFVTAIQYLLIFLENKKKQTFLIVTA